MFYTYTYFINGEPSYVGKGTKRENAQKERCLKHITLKPRTYWERHLSKRIDEGCELEILVYDFETEKQALDEEVRLIASYGRKSLGTGPLFNLTIGGEGVVGMKASAETKQKLRIAKLGKKRTLESRIAQSIAQTGKKVTMPMGIKRSWSEEAKQRAKGRGTGRVMSAATKHKMSEAQSARWIKRNGEVI